MASVILVVGFMGMIQAITLGSEMMATARRQTLASQILEHEIGKLRLLPFSTIDGYAAGPTAVAIDSYFSASIASCGLTTDTSVSTNPYIKLERTVTDVISGSLCEVTFTVTWQKSGTTTAANQASGSWLDALSFSGNAPIARTYTRKATTFFGKYGLNNSIQRS